MHVPCWRRIVSGVDEMSGSFCAYQSRAVQTPLCFVSFDRIYFWKIFPMC
jgi:hypothetical protein